MTHKAEEREQREWWYADVDSGKAVRVVGFACGPDNPNYWWCPSVGVSASVGYALFDTEGEAIARVRALLQRSIAELRQKLAKLASRGSTEPTP